MDFGVMNAQLLIGDVRDAARTLEADSCQTIITSPPYWGLRDYGQPGQLGLEATPDEYVSNLTAVLNDLRKPLAGNGTLWLNLGDSYAAGKMGRDDSGEGGKFAGPRIKPKQRAAPPGFKPKDLVGIPWRVAFALQASGWYLRQDVIWHKPNPMPESVTDRCTKAHEYLFLLSTSERYFFDNKAIAEPAARGAWDAMPSIGGTKHAANGAHRTHSGATPPGDGMRNRRDVWTIPTKPYRGAHFAVMPEALVEPCVLAATKPGDLVLDPFAGSGTVGVVALNHGRRFVGCELNREYAWLAESRIRESNPLFNEVSVNEL